MATKGKVDINSGGFGAFSRRFGGRKKAQEQRMNGLQRAMSDLSLELNKETIDDSRKLPPISEVENVRCECCGMSEECTPAYIKGVREKFSGRWICGLCSEAVKEEMEKLGGNKEEAIIAHMSVCSKFSRIGRKQPVLYQAEAMREILRRCSSRLGDPKLAAAAAGKKDKGGIMRTSSCIAAITKETNEGWTNITSFDDDDTSLINIYRLSSSSYKCHDSGKIGLNVFEPMPRDSSCWSSNVLHLLNCDV